MRTIKSQVGTVILSWKRGRLYGEPTGICNCRSQRNGCPVSGQEIRTMGASSDLQLPA
jgi:hypothetical protein